MTSARQRRRRASSVHPPSVGKEGEPWVAALLHKEYDALPLSQRIDALGWLCGVVGEGPAVRTAMVARDRELQRIRHAMQEDIKVG